MGPPNFIGFRFITLFLFGDFIYRIIVAFNWAHIYILYENNPEDMDRTDWILFAVNVTINIP